MKDIKDEIIKTIKEQNCSVMEAFMIITAKENNNGIYQVQCKPTK